jgi:hypothetical protein
MSVPVLQVGFLEIILTNPPIAPPPYNVDAEPFMSQPAANLKAEQKEHPILH